MWRVSCVADGVRVRCPQNGETALMKAAFNGHTAIATLLVESKADLDAMNKVCGGAGGAMVQVTAVVR